MPSRPKFPWSRGPRGSSSVAGAYRRWPALHYMRDPVDRGGLDRRNVERELEGLPQAHWPALEAIGVMGYVSAAEVGGDIHEHRPRRHAAVLDTHGVVDRLERRAGLSPHAAGEHVELGIEEVLVGLRWVRNQFPVEVGATRIGEDLAGAV